MTMTNLVGNLPAVQTLAARVLGTSRDRECKLQ